MSKNISHSEATALVEQIRMLELRRAALLGDPSPEADKVSDEIGAEIESIVVSLINDTHSMPDAERDAILAMLDKEEAEAAAEISYIRDERPPIIEDSDIRW